MRTDKKGEPEGSPVWSSGATPSGRRAAVRRAAAIVDFGMEVAVGLCVKPRLENDLPAGEECDTGRARDAERGGADRILGLFEFDGIKFDISIGRTHC